MDLKIALLLLTAMLKLRTLLLLALLANASLSLRPLGELLSECFPHSLEMLIHNALMNIRICKLTFYRANQKKDKRKK